jgi:hypothetical protein
VIKLKFRVVEPQATKISPDRPFIRPTGIRPESGSSDNVTSKGWAGATSTAIPSGWSYALNGAEWTAPDATIYFKGEVPDGPTSINAYVGLAGEYSGNPSFPGQYPVIGIGTNSYAVVTNGAVEAGSQTASAWFISWSEIFLINIPVNPGDQVGASMYGVGPGSTPLTTTTFQFWNFTQKLTTSVTWNPPAFQATIAEWLVGAEPYLIDENLPSEYPLTSGLQFTDCLAIAYNETQSESTEIDLSGAVFVNTILPSGEESVTVQLGPESFEIEQCTIL